MTSVRLMTCNPGHFHAALVQKEMYAEVDPRVHIYGPLGPDLLLHLNRIVGFNTRASNPTSWQVEVHAGSGALERMLKEKPGNVVVLAGFNNEKINVIKAAVEAGLNVLADKPWVIHAADLPKLKSALDTADSKALIAYDIMTERYEITSLLQREFVNDADTFGAVVPGTVDEPAVFIESVHYLMKSVAGVPNRRPAWYFDVLQQGEGLTDVGTHLVDLVPWMLFPNQALDAAKDVAVLAAKRWPTVMSCTDYQRVTGDADFPAFLNANIRNGQLDYFCNTLVSYAVRGIHVKLNVLWDFEAMAGSGDTHFAVFRGTKARVEIRQRKEENYRPELFIVPVTGKAADVAAATAKKVQTLQTRYPGIAVEDLRGELRINIPDVFRVGHEAHFAEVARQFLKYLKDPKSLPAWEKPNMLAKYHTTTRGVERANQI